MPRTWIPTSAAFTACLLAPNRMRSGWGDAGGNCGASSAIGNFGAAASAHDRRSGFFRLITKQRTRRGCPGGFGVAGRDIIRPSSKACRPLKHYFEVNRYSNCCVQAT